MRYGRTGLVLVGLLLFAPAAYAEPNVILLSWDGLRHDHPDLYPTPALERLETEGARAERLIPVLPSNTFPGHVSLATGTYPDRHGILDNAFFDRERGSFQKDDAASWLEAEPLWVAAERQGLAAATYFWAGSETDWHGIGARHRVAPFDSGIDEQAKVDQILAWLDLPDASRPRLVMSWWHGADRAGHRHGPQASEVAASIATQSEALARLLAGLDARGSWSDTTLLLVSDHGMTEVIATIPIAAALEDAGIEARIESGSSIAHVFLPQAARAAAATALAGLSHVTVHPRASLPPSLRLSHPTRTGDFVVLADPGHVLRNPSLKTQILAGLARWFGGTLGTHGYAPDHPDMGGVFFALGRGVAPGTSLPPVRMIDVAPTVAWLLGIEPPRDAEGGALLLSGVGAVAE